MIEIELQELHIWNSELDILEIWNVSQEIDKERNVIREISRIKVGVLEVYDNITATNKIKELELRLKSVK